jgi:hypothetical protein
MLGAQQAPVPLITVDDLELAGVGVEKVSTNQLIFMRSVRQCEMFSSIV